jgi:hypothetical protein
MKCFGFSTGATVGQSGFAPPSQLLHATGVKLPPVAAVQVEGTAASAADLLPEVWCVMSDSVVSARGTPLTPVVELTGPDGIQWIAYVEGIPPVRHWHLLSETVLPGRRMRFDSGDDSRVNPTVPAGSPFLAGRGLQALLAGATSLPQSQSASPSRSSLPPRRWHRSRAGRAWARVCDTAARASRGTLRWIGEEVLAGMMVVRRADLAAADAVPSRAQPSYRRRYAARGWRRRLPGPGLVGPRLAHACALSPKRVPSRDSSVSGLVSGPPSSAGR